MTIGARGRGLVNRRRNRQGATVELTPLIDIVFQLLIFFLLTATFKDFSSLDVELAEAKNQERSTEQKAVVVSIGNGGEIEIEGKIVDQRELEIRLCKEGDSGKDTLHIRADKDSRHENLVFTMDTAKRCGFKKLGILHTAG